MASDNYICFYEKFDFTLCLSKSYALMLFISTLVVSNITNFGKGVEKIVMNITRKRIKIENPCFQQF